MQKRVPFLLSMICVVIGFMVSIQFQTNYVVERADPRDMNEIRILLQKERERTQLLLSEISKHEHLLYQYEMSMNKEGEINNVMEQELKRIKLIAGVEDMVGKGAIIRIQEDEELENDFFTPLVFDEDFRVIINHLNSYGAKAISINDQRIISTTAIRNVGDRILVNMVPIHPPYEIKVIGDDPAMLITALKLEGLDSYFMVVNHVVDYEERTYLRVKAYSHSIEPRHLKAVKEDNR